MAPLTRSRSTGVPLLAGLPYAKRAPRPPRNRRLTPPGTAILPQSWVPDPVVYATPAQIYAENAPARQRAKAKKERNSGIVGRVGKVRRWREIEKKLGKLQRYRDEKGRWISQAKHIEMVVKAFAGEQLEKDIYHDTGLYVDIGVSEWRF